MNKPIAFFGANSKISQDILAEISKSPYYLNQKIDLYCRNKNKFHDDIQEIIKENPAIRVRYYNEFTANERYKSIINFIGLGNPSKVNSSAQEMYLASEKYDLKILKYLSINPTCRYINLSSGAVYGINKSKIKWDQNKTQIVIPLTNSTNQDYYLYSKLTQEIRHRAHKDLNIVDLRVFGYISKNIDLNDSYFLAELFGAKLKCTSLKTDHADFYRDYVGSSEVFDALMCLIEAPNNFNRAYDVYSLMPAKKSELIKELKVDCTYTDNKKEYYPIERRFSYYPTNFELNELGYVAKRTTIKLVREVFEEITE